MESLCSYTFLERVSFSSAFFINSFSYFKNGTCICSLPSEETGRASLVVNIPSLSVFYIFELSTMFLKVHITFSIQDIKIGQSVKNLQTADILKKISCSLCTYLDRAYMYHI